VTIPFRSLTPFAHVRSVPDSIAFYQRLGFTLGNTFQPPDAEQPTWAWLYSGEAALMVALASEPVGASQQAVLFYLYVEDVAAKHAELEAAGLDVGAIASPFYAPRGEFRMTDPDGYVLMITHT
jgi:catechol 2,3-dioxygenase-like lactoylglutathione lyase family enzyme